jgi:Ca2+-binding RTX toxin-like protein
MDGVTGKNPMRRFSLVSLLVAAFFALALSGAPTASAQEAVAASCEPPRDDDTFGHPKQAQTFTAALAGSLTRAELDVAEEGGTGDWVVEIGTVDDSTGAPTNVVLASATLADASVPTGYSFHSVVFANPPTVMAGEQYALAVSRPGTPDNTWGVSVRTGDDCPGQAWRFTGGAWVPTAGLDFVFRVFVSPATCKGTPATIAGTAGPDDIVGTAGRDVIAALDGDDEISGLQANDLICGGGDRDKLRGGRGKDKLFGQKGKDRLFGQKGKDKLRGGGGKDVCRGGKGNDSAKCEVERSI